MRQRGIHLDDLSLQIQEGNSDWQQLEQRAQLFFVLARGSLTLAQCIFDSLAFRNLISQGLIDGP